MSLGPAAVRERLGDLGQRLAAGGEPHGAGTMPLDDLAHQPRVRELVHDMARELGTDDLPVAASQWVKQYAATVVMAPLAAFTLADVTTDLSRVRVRVDGARPSMLEVGVGEWVPAKSDRDAARSRLHADLFTHRVAPVLAAVRAESGASSRVLWANVGNLVDWLFDRMLRDAHADAARVREDREALLLQEPAGVPAGALRDAVRREDAVLPDGRCVVARVRRTCCLKDRLPGGTACYSCPAVPPAERARLLHEHGGA